MNAYINDILSQSNALTSLADKINHKEIVELKKRIQNDEFDRIIISGMGASYYAGYPAYLLLSQLPIPVMYVNTAELVNYLPGQISSRTLLWLNSQSGRSAELVHLIQKYHKPAYGGLIVFVNNMDSPLAEAADYCINIHAGEEFTVSVKTYTNMLAANSISAALLSQDVSISDLIPELKATINKLQSFLEDLLENQAFLTKSVEKADTLFFLGRGASLAAVWTGSLINKEAAKCSFEGSNCADFRHGPLEMVRKGVVTIIYAGDDISRPLNRQLAFDIQKNGGSVVWVDNKPDPDLTSFILPEVPGIFAPLVEIVPMQLMTLIMADKAGVEPGIFKIVGKITTVE